MAFYNRQKTCFLLSSDNVQNANIRPYLMAALQQKFQKVNSVGDRRAREDGSEIYWKGAFQREKMIYEPIIFFRLFLIFLKYRPTNVVSFSPRVNIYAGILSWFFLARHVPVISGLGKMAKKIENKKTVLRILLWISLKTSRGIITMNQSNFNFFRELFHSKDLLKIPSEGYQHKNSPSPIKNYSKKNIFYISRIISEKGIILLLRAFKNLKTCTGRLQWRTATFP